MAGGPERSVLNFNVDIKGIAAWLGGHVEGIDLEGPCDSAESGHEGGCGVLALLLGLLGNAWQAFSATVLEIIAAPEI